RYVGHGEGVVEAPLGGLEAGGHVEDRLAVLDGGDPAGRERAAVPYPIDLVEHGDPGGAGPQEVAVQRVAQPGVGHRAGPGGQRLAGHLAAEEALAVLVGGHAPEDVDLDRFEVEQLHEVVDRLLGHGGKVPCRPVSTESTTFPDGFEWGTATAAHQIEGGNVN